MSDYLDDPLALESSEFADVHDQTSLWSARFGSFLLDQLELRAGIRALDFGCGTGFPLFELAEVHGRSCRFVGIDVWKHAVRRAARKREFYRSPNVELVEADAMRMPFADGQFDLVVSNLGINNIDDRRAALAECARVMKPGARLALTTNTRGHLRELYAVFEDLLEELGRTEYVERLAENEAHRGTPESHRRLLEECGLSVVRTVEERCSLRFVDGSALLGHSLVRSGFLPDWTDLLDRADRRRVLSTLESRLNRVAGENGELKMTVPMLYLEARKPR